jgi:hypothetical protein
VQILSKGKELPTPRPTGCPHTHAPIAARKLRHRDQAHSSHLPHSPHPHLFHAPAAPAATWPPQNAHVSLALGATLLSPCCCCCCCLPMLPAAAAAAGCCCCRCRCFCPCCCCCCCRPLLPLMPPTPSLPLEGCAAGLSLLLLALHSPPPGALHLGWLTHTPTPHALDTWTAFRVGVAIHPPGRGLCQQPDTLSTGGRNIATPHSAGLSWCSHCVCINS